MGGHSDTSQLGIDGRPSVQAPTLVSGSHQSEVIGPVREIESLLRTLLASWHESSRILQSRRWHRIAFRKPFALIPLNAETFAPNGKQTLIHGRDLSCGGLSFSHVNPMPYRIVAITFPSQASGCNSIVTRLTWCRFCRDHTFLSGGKFLGKIELDFGNGIDWGRLPAA